MITNMNLDFKKKKKFSKKTLCHMLCLHLYNNLQNDGLNVLNQVIISTGMNILCLLMDYNSLIYWITICPSEEKEIRKNVQKEIILILCLHI